MSKKDKKNKGENIKIITGERLEFCETRPVEVRICDCNDCILKKRNMRK